MGPHLPLEMDSEYIGAYYEIVLHGSFWRTHDFFDIERVDRANMSQCAIVLLV